MEDKQPEKRKSSSTAKLSSKREVTKIILSSDSEDDDDDTKPLPTTSKKEASTKRQITKLTSDLVDKEPTYEMSFGDEESNAKFYGRRIWKAKCACAILSSLEKKIVSLQKKIREFTK